MTRAVQGSRAFSLVEMLVVLGIIVLAAGLFLGPGRGGAEAGLGAAGRILSGMVQGARGQAVLRGARTRLILHDDPADPEKCRRYVGIVCESAPGSGQWIAATQGVYLPEGICFDPGMSRLNPGGSGPGAQSMVLEYPRSAPRAEGTGERFVYYAFEPNGTAAGANAWLVFRAGSVGLAASGGESITFRSDPSKEMLRAALVLRRSGTATLVTEPGAIRTADVVD